MCSICGIATSETHPPAESSLPEVLNMLRRTRHRGPDGAGVWADGTRVTASDPDLLPAQANALAAGARVVLGQSRLAITGTGDALQPFTSADGALALAHNGEIYNHVELARLVEDDGRPRPRSDSEALLRVLERHYAATGNDLAEAMRRTVRVAHGMYALAATDGRIVVLARDPVGKKPLYYVAGRERFAWASERKALVTVARDEERTIRRLQPGEVLVCDETLSVRTARVERLSPPAMDIHDLDVAVDEYAKAIDVAIDRRTQGLARAAVLFSGGVDSVMVARLLQRAGVETTGYVSGVADSNDVRAAVSVAQKMGLPTRVVPVDEDALESALPAILEHTELHGPLMAEVSIPMWFASKAASEDGHRVIFTGQAADELFAGYSWYRDLVRNHDHLTLHARLWEDLCMLPLDTLEREDRITMAWGMEMRAPFLDDDVVRVAFRTAPHLKLRDANDAFGKRPHRILAERLGVPNEVAWRTKEPAQDGASVHDLLARVAKRRFPNAQTDVEPPPDFGSNYRYRDTLGEYATPAVHQLLTETVRRGGFVVAMADGTASAPDPPFGEPTLPESPMVVARRA